MRMGKVDVVIEQIRRLLQQDTRGLTIQELADKTNVSRVTAGMALMKIEGAGVIDVRIIGNCKLHYWKTEKRKYNG